MHTYCIQHPKVLRSMTVCGIRSFKVQLHEYPHPFGIRKGTNGVSTNGATAVFVAF